MENLTLERLVAETQEALCQADASNYYKNVFKTLTKQFLLYAHDKGVDSFNMDFGIQFLEEHYSMSEKIAKGKWCAAYTRSMNALSEYQLFGTVSLYLATDKRTYSFPDGFRSSAEAYLSYRKKIGISNKSNRVNDTI